jgi:glutathione S-transferase
LLDVPVELVLVNFAKAEQKSPEFVKLNSFGQVPVLVDDGAIVSDSNAILVYLALKYRRDDWLPIDPRGAAQVQKWFPIAAGEVVHGAAAARRVRLFLQKPVPEEVPGRSYRLLALLDAELKQSDWLVAGRPRSQIFRSTDMSPAPRKVAST